MVDRNYDFEEEAQVVSINVSRGGIPKLPINPAQVTFRGLVGDGHHHEKHNNPDQAVCMQDIELLRELSQEGFPVAAGIIGENLTVKDLNVQQLPPGSILEFSGGVVLELTKERKPCYVLDAVHPQLKERIVGRCGFYAKVLQEGILEVGATIHLIDKPFVYRRNVSDTVRERFRP